MTGEVLGHWGAPRSPDLQSGPHGEPEAETDSLPLLELVGITKRFPGVVANDDVTFSIGEQQIHALLGENGAGKSTLVKTIYGLMRPDAGSMRFNGQVYAPSSPAEARDRGVGMVFQHFSLFEGLTVAENIALGMSTQRIGRDLSARIADVSAAYGLKLDPARQVGRLSAGERQRVEIVRCLLQEPRLIIMDEPTSVLTPQEIDTLFSTLRRLVVEGCSILYISHKLEEIRTLCHHATILRGGRVVATCDPGRETPRSLAEMMVGRIVVPPRRERSSPGPVRLQVRRLNLPREEHFGVDLEDIDLEVRGGEILGIAGIAGNGQTELMDALAGERLALSRDTIIIDGTGAGRVGPAGRRALGLCSVREERLGHASVPDMSLWENAVLTARTRMRLSRHGLLDKRQTQALTNRVINDFDVRTQGADSIARSLSGGNLQKFVVGREVLQCPSVLVVAQPTWGIDAGAAIAIHEHLLRLARSGSAILVISQDLDELFAIADRIAVIANGRLSKAQPVDRLTAEAVGSSMAGRGTAEPMHA